VTPGFSTAGVRREVSCGVASNEKRAIMTKTGKDRVKRWRQKKAQKGGRSLSAWLEPETAQMLEQLLGHYGETTSPLIGRAIKTLYDVTSERGGPSLPSRSPNGLREEPSSEIEAREEAGMAREPVEEGSGEDRRLESELSGEAVLAEGEAVPGKEREPSAKEETDRGESMEGLACESEEAEDLLERMKEELGAGASLKSLKDSLLVKWILILRRRGCPFEAMAGMLNQASIPVLPGHDRWEKGVLTTLFILNYPAVAKGADADQDSPSRAS